MQRLVCQHHVIWFIVSCVYFLGLVNLRNELCQGLLLGLTKSTTEEESIEYTVDALPEPINNSRMCEKCPHLLTCSLHQS